MKKIMLVCMMGIMAIVFSACPTPENNDNKNKNNDEDIDVLALIQKSIWEDDAKSDCGTGYDGNSGNTDKYMIAFDSSGEYYSAHFDALNDTYVSDTDCDATSGWPTTITRAEYLEAGKNPTPGATKTYRVSGNTITVLTDFTKDTFTDKTSTMTYSANDGGSITDNITNTVYTILDKSWDK